MKKKTFEPDWQEPKETAAATETTPEETTPKETTPEETPEEAKPKEVEAADTPEETTPEKAEEEEPAEPITAESDWTRYSPDRGRLIGAGTKLVLGGEVVTLNSPAYITYPRAANERYFFGMLMTSTHPDENIDANAQLLDNTYNRTTGAVVTED